MDDKNNTTYLECDNCYFKSVCDYYEPGKKACDYQLDLSDLDINNLESIKIGVQELIATEIKRLKRLELLYKIRGDDPAIFETSTRCAGRILSMFRDYANVREKLDGEEAKEIWEKLLGDIE